MQAPGRCAWRQLLLVHGQEVGVAEKGMWKHQVRENGVGKEEIGDAGVGREVGQGLRDVLPVTGHEDGMVVRIVGGFRSSPSYLLYVVRALSRVVRHIYRVYFLFPGGRSRLVREGGPLEDPLQLQAVE